MTGRTVAATLGFVLILAGAVVGFLPRTVQGVSCGSAFLDNGSAAITDLIGETRGAASACDDARSTTRLPALILLPIGAVLLVGSALGRQPGGTQQPPTPHIP